MRTILVVDDEPAVLNLCRSILQFAGYTVVSATSGEEGLRLFKNNAIDLALLDIVMPVMNGIELAVRIRAVNETVPIVLMTGYSVKEIQHVLASNNPYPIIWKPFKTESFLRMIENMLDSRPTDETSDSR